MPHKMKECIHSTPTKPNKKTIDLATCPHTWYIIHMNISLTTCHEYFWIHPPCLNKHPTQNERSIHSTPTKQKRNEKKKMIDLATSPYTYQVSSDSQCMMTRKPAGLLVKALDCGSKSPGQPYLKNWVQGFLLRPLEGTLSRQSWGTP